jgi:septal ring factor EnvC (AmiA/AmiB activator)
MLMDLHRFRAFAPVWVFSALVSLTPNGVAETATATKTKLEQLENKMTVLKQTLHTVHNKQETLNQELSRTEKEITNTTRQLAIIKKNILEKQQQIQVLNQLIETLNHQLVTQRSLLAKHIRARYKIGEHQLMKWPLNQDDPYTINRLLVFYQYIVKARQHTINQVVETQRQLNQNQQKLNQETQKQQLLENQVKQRQKQLNLTKNYHAALIRSIDKDIQNKQNTMKQYQFNRDNLSKLINALHRQSVTKKPYPFFRKRLHFSKPVMTTRNNVEKSNQGLLFLAAEGTPVFAVYPGKIVFSDWLNGYGLLLIVDHGEGYMTLYAHNQSLFKKKGEPVLQGEKIASVGHSGALRENGLYFEVRVGGKAVSPLEWFS